eukprot:scaffold21569_cov107-Isochrysis_galbana.AAC.8
MSTAPRGRSCPSPPRQTSPCRGRMARAPAQVPVGAGRPRSRIGRRPPRGQACGGRSWLLWRAAAMAPRHRQLPPPAARAKPEPLGGPASASPAPFA